MKLPKDQYPADHGPHDFQCFGPAALRDGEFDGCLIADLGFFSQEDKDSSKFYHGAVVQSRKTGAWYAYFEWGRQGSGSSMQFETGITREDAQAIFAKKMHEKNDRRGVWTTIAGLKTLTCKPGKDCYLVRPLATRVTGLPDAKTIKSDDGARAGSLPAPKAPGGKEVAAVTVKLLRDLGFGAVAFTRSSMADASLPTQVSIDEARQLLDAATERVGLIGGRAEDQVTDPDLNSITAMLYKRIPKAKARNAPAATWILSADNIVGWRNDLDAFESAIYTKTDAVEAEADPYDGMNIEMGHLDPRSPVGEFLQSWWPNATRRRHANMGEMEIVNAWSVHQQDGIKPFADALSRVAADRVLHRPLHQPPSRLDLSPEDQKVFERSHVMLGFHGTRSCNVSGILRKRLLLPKKLQGVSINGALLGPGLYWADDIRKSCQYVSIAGAAWSKGSGAVPGRGAFMFIADVIVGNPFRPRDKHGYTSPPPGHHSVFGEGDYTAALQNNEWVVYDESQHRLRYLIEFKEKAKKRFG